MAVRDCAIVALEGTHASGKTSLGFALAAACALRGVDARLVEDTARTSPYCIDIVIGGRGQFDLAAELDLVLDHLHHVWRAAMHADVVICDKSIVSVPVYARELTRSGAGALTSDDLDRLESMVELMTPVYDLLVLCEDRYDSPGDQFRAKVDGLQESVATSVRLGLERAGVPVEAVPPGLSNDERVSAVLPRVLQLCSDVGSRR